MATEIRVEIVFALPDEQVLVSVSVPATTTVASAIRLSGLAERFADQPIDSLPVGIWGRLVGRDHVLSNTDRVEIYRPLKLEPREARRQLAQAGRTMGGGRKVSGS